MIEATRDYDVFKDAGKMSALFHRALKRAVDDGDAGAQAMAHDGLGMIAVSQGKLQTALSEYQTSLRIWPAASEPAEQAFTLCSLGVLLLELGAPTEALGVYGEALNLLKREDRRDVRIEVFDGIGLALHDLGQRERAIAAYKVALSLARTSREEGRFRSRLANVYRDQGDLDLAWEELQKARILAHKSGDTRWEAFALADLAHIEDLRGREREGLRLFDWAFKLLSTFPEPMPKVSNRFGRAEVLRDLGRFEDALKAVKESIDWVEPVRADLIDPGMRVKFFSARQRYYELYVTLFMDLHRRDPKGGWLAKAFEARDRSHSRSLLDDVAGEPTAQGWGLQEIQKELLDGETTLLAYSLGDRGSFLWVVNRDRIAAFNLPRRQFVEDIAARAWESLSEGKGGAEVQELARMLLPDGIGPLLRRRLLISPDGYLHQIPFSLMRQPGQPSLVESHIISSLPSASYLVGMRRLLRSRRPAPKELAVLGNPVFGREDKRLGGLGRGGTERPKEPGDLMATHLDPLIFSEQEALNILALVPSDSRFVALGFKASRTLALDPMLASYRMIHITTHFIGGDHPEFTGLMLSRYDDKGQPIEGLVRASEIYGLSLPAELVVLSACGSGLGRRIRGEGPMGMTRAFLHAGAKRVVVSLWDVTDQTTTELMTRFYSQMLQRGLPPAEALRAAQLSMAHDPNPKWRSPRVWGAFVLQGEPR
jgi:CHAT domain-containing protein/tetratricopeptide (TPR) repeat protein